MGKPPTLAANEHRRVSTNLASRPRWIRIGERLGYLQLLGVDSMEGFDCALARGLDYIGHPWFWWFDTMEHTHGHPWHVSFVWVGVRRPKKARLAEKSRKR
jgi:hypothetical protein